MFLTPSAPWKFHARNLAIKPLETFLGGDVNWHFLRDTVSPSSSSRVQRSTVPLDSARATWSPGPVPDSAQSSTTKHAASA
eukprot:7424673-Pyramimonas_sp.AAC.1